MRTSSVIVSMKFIQVVPAIIFLRKLLRVAGRPNVFQIAQTLKTENFTQFVSAIVEANLTDDLIGAGPLSK